MFYTASAFQKALDNMTSTQSADYDYFVAHGYSNLAAYALSIMEEIPNTIEQGPKVKSQVVIQYDFWGGRQ